MPELTKPLDLLGASPEVRRAIAEIGAIGPAFLVGGALRDALLGVPSLDFDVAVEGDAHSFAEQLAERIDGELTLNEAFGTATVSHGAITIDLAATRSETYSRPGALPEVRPAPIELDLARRDFTVNAIAVGLSGERLGELIDLHHGREDLTSKTLRVLHGQSFIDDPTRLLRGLRYEARLEFRMDQETESLARSAASGRALATLSGRRLGDAFLLLLAEQEIAVALSRLRELEIDLGFPVPVRIDPELCASAALGSVQTGADRITAVLAAIASAAGDRAGEWIEALSLPGRIAGPAARAAVAGAEITNLLKPGMRPSEVHRLLSLEPAESLALALALAAPADLILRFVSEWNLVRLEIDGSDLVAAGLPESPLLGAALAFVFGLRLDGEISGRDQELAAALAFAERAIR